MSEEVQQESYRISWSSLQTWELCRQKWWLQSQRKSSPIKDSRNFFHGTVADRIMRAWLDDPQPGAMPGMVADYMDKCEKEGQESGDGIVKWRHRTDREDVQNFCVELVTRLEPILYELVVPFDYEPAKRFKVPINLPGIDDIPVEVTLTGEFDLLVRDKTPAFNVWDLKATADNSYWKKTLGQLVFYDLAVWCMMGESPAKAGLIQPMCDQRVVDFTFTNDDRRAMLARIIAMLRSMQRQEREPKEDPQGCFFCQVRHGCSKYSNPNPFGALPLD